MRTKRIINGVKCDVCNTKVYETVSGSVCKNGHGGMPYHLKKTSMASAVKSKAKKSKWKHALSKHNKGNLFENRKINIVLNDEGKVHLKKVNCYCLGEYAYHVGISHDGYSVVEVKSGLCIGQFNSEKTVKYIVKQLNVKMKKGFPSVKDIQSFREWFTELEYVREQIWEGIKQLENKGMMPLGEVQNKGVTTQQEDDIPF